MSTQIQRRRGTTSEHSSFTGAAGEITIDSTKNTIVVHNGSTQGGFPLAKESALVSTVGALTDVTISSVGAGEILKYSGSEWVNNTLAEAGIQAYDADTAKLDATTANFTGTLQNGGSNVVVDSDIGSTVQAFDADTAKLDATTANFTGTLQNGGSNVVVDTDIGSTVQGYDANLPAWPSSVNATEVGYLDGVTSSIQTQINAKAGTGKAIAMAIVFG
jgi:hypothetical protein